MSHVMSSHMSCHESASETTSICIYYILGAEAEAPEAALKPIHSELFTRVCPSVRTAPFFLKTKSDANFDEWNHSETIT